MADNETNNFSTEGFEQYIGSDGVTIIIWIMFGLNLIAVIYGVTSWYLVKKFRHFRNYVFISAILAKTSILLLFFFTDLSPESLTIDMIKAHIYADVIMIYSELSCRCWLLVLCFVFYVDFVKVFSLDIQRRYLKSSLFAWGVPLISTMISFVPLLFYYFSATSKRNTQYMLYFSIYTMLIIPVAISFGIYLTVLYSLHTGRLASETTSRNKLCRFYIASLIFVLSNVIVLPTVIELFGVNIFAISAIMELGAIINAIALPVYIIVLKRNRELWREFLNKRLKPVKK